MFLARVIADDRLFMGQYDAETIRDVHKIEKGKEYMGIVFSPPPLREGLMEYTEASTAKFRADQLEEIFGEFLMRFKKTNSGI